MNQSGMGFAIYLDEAFLSERQTASLPIENEYLKIALPKGRMAQKVIEIFEKSDLCAKDTLKDNRQLIFTDEEHKLQFYLVKPSDVAIYVEHGVADIGIVGQRCIDGKSTGCTRATRFKFWKMCVSNRWF